MKETAKVSKNKKKVTVKIGKRSKTYEYRENVPLKVYIKAYKEGWNKTKLAKEERKTARATEGEAKKKIKKIIKEVRKKGKLSTIIKKEIVSQKVDMNALTTKAGIDKAYKKIFDKIAQGRKEKNRLNQNRKKLGKHLAYEIRATGTSKGQRGRTLLNIKDPIGRTIEEMVELYRGKNTIREGAVLTSTSGNRIAERSGLNKKLVTQDRNGTIRKVEVTIIWR